MIEVDVLVQRLDPELELPQRQHPGDAGLDLQTSIDCEVAPGDRTLLPTGVAIALPDGFVAFVVPRSGLAVKFGVSLVNAPGTIDAGYRGEIKVSVVNLDSTDPVRFRRGDRVAQLIVQQIPRVRLHEVAKLPRSERDSGGFGSTGLRGLSLANKSVADPTIKDNE
jgi:dUTP pyrophosphatase